MSKNDPTKNVGEPKYGNVFQRAEIYQYCPPMNKCMFNQILTMRCPFYIVFSIFKVQV
jgi:hypothetical protein